MNTDPLPLPETATAGAVSPLLEPWLRLCAGNMELLANYDRLRGTNLCGRGTPIDRLLDEAPGRLEEEALAFFDWCREMFERQGWETPDEYTPQMGKGKDLEALNHSLRTEI